MKDILLRSAGRTVLVVVAVAGAYFAAARLGLALAFVEQKVTLVWPPSGVALAAVLMFGRRALPGVALGALAANVSTGSPWLFCVATAVGNPLEAAAGAWLLGQVRGFDRGLGRLRDVVSFVVVGAVLSPPFSATPGVLALCASSAAPWGAFGSIWLGWCLGDGMGALLFAPALMGWGTGRAGWWRHGRWWEFAGLLALISGTGAAVFLTVLPQQLHYLQRPYFLLPLLLWAVVRLGSGGAGVAVAVTSAIALAGTAAGTGPFASGSTQENLALLMAFMSMISLVSLTLGAVLAERDAAREHVTQANAELERRVEERTRELEEQRRTALDAQESLRTVSTLQRAILDGANYAIVSTDPEGKVTTFNRGAEAMLGYAASEVVGQTTPALWHDAREIMRRSAELTREVGRAVEPGFEVFVAKARHGGADENEWTFLRKDGSRLPVLLSVTALRDHDEKITGFLGVIADITARKQAEAEKNRLLAIIEECPDFIGTADLEGRLLYHNRAARQLVGLPPEADLSRMNIRDMHPEWGARRVLEEGIPAVLACGTWQGENALLHRSGHEVPVLQALMLHRNEAGEPEFLSTLMRDITAPKQAEAEKRASEERFRILVEGVTDYAILLLDAQGRIASWNAGAERIKGYRAEEILARHFSIFYPPEALETGRPQEILRTAATLGKCEEEGWRMRKDGTRFWANVVVTAIRDGEGKVQGFSKVTRDLTERKQTENALRAALGEKEILLREIHHRVKNNMQVISSILSLQAGYIEDVRTRSLFTECQDRVQSMAMIHEKLFRSPNLASIDFGTHIRELTEMLVWSFGEVAGRVRLEVEAEPMTLDLDTAIPVGLILNELITNALKYAFPGGRAGHLRVSLRLEEPGRLLLCVADDGVGLPAAFEAGQAQSLGLKMIRSLTRQIKGTLEVRQDRGAEFRVRFPAPADPAVKLKAP